MCLNMNICLTCIFVCSWWKPWRSRRRSTYACDSTWTKSSCLSWTTTPPFWRSRTSKDLTRVENVSWSLASKDHSSCLIKAWDPSQETCTGGKQRQPYRVFLCKRMSVARCCPWWELFLQCKGALRWTKGTFFWARECSPDSWFYNCDFSSQPATSFVLCCCDL